MKIREDLKKWKTFLVWLAKWVYYDIKSDFSGKKSEIISRWIRTAQLLASIVTIGLANLALAYIFPKFATWLISVNGSGVSTQIVLFATILTVIYWFLWVIWKKLGGREWFKIWEVPSDTS